MTHESAHTTPFDVVSPNVVFGLDVVNLVNFSGVSIPKYNNFVMKKEMFDKKTKINLQKFLFDTAVSYRSVTSFADNNCMTVSPSVCLSARPFVL